MVKTEVFQNMTTIFFIMLSISGLYWALVDIYCNLIWRDFLRIGSLSISPWAGGLTEIRQPHST
jgi:hypothetical protein